MLFHLIGALSEFGKLGLTAIGNSREEVNELYVRTLDRPRQRDALHAMTRRVAMVAPDL